MRQGREYSKATLSKATAILFAENRLLLATERRRWLPRVIASALAGFAVGATLAWGLTRVLS